MASQSAIQYYRAAVRLGFVYEGLFRQASVYKDRSRDTAWHSIIDTEWPARKTAFESWLAAENFDASGTQRQPLSAFMSAEALSREGGYDRTSNDGGQP